MERTIRLPNDGSILFWIPYILMTTDITNQYLGNYAIENNQADFHKEVFRNDFSDKPIWQEIQAILADAEIYFKYPYEIILNEISQSQTGIASFSHMWNFLKRHRNQR